ncbi:MAG: hypothetical protein KAJ09_08835 [Deltaproteobacteria bacterium]|nr:hypothetical protein [Deltaproteobacteria bacterium]
MLKRRKFLKAIGAALATGISVFSSRRAFSKSGGMEGHGHMAHPQLENHTHKAMAKYPPIAWADPNIPISPLPPLMGKYCVLDTVTGKVVDKKAETHTKRE